MKYGELQELILKKCSLLIYNIEYTEIYYKENKNFQILGLDECLFSNLISDDIEFDKFIVYDRKRDENGCVIKENKVIDKYNEWYINNENENYIKMCNNSNSNLNPNTNFTFSPFTSIFSNMNDMDYINNIFRNYVNTPSNNNANETGNEEEEPLLNQTSSTEIDESTINIVRDVFHNNEEEFNNLVNIFDRYINNQASQSANLYNHFMNIYNNVNENLNEPVEEEKDEPENNNQSQLNETEIKPNNEQQEQQQEPEETEPQPELEENDNNLTDTLIDTPILSIFDIFRNPNISISTPIITTNTNSIIFNIPIDIYQPAPASLMEDVVVSLTDEEFNDLTCVECNSNDELIGKECGVCMDVFEQSNEIIKLNCCHNYHKECIKKWLCTRSTKCPICRIEVAKGMANI